MCLLESDRKSDHSWLILPLSSDLQREMMSFLEEKLGSDLPRRGGALKQSLARAMRNSQASTVLNLDTHVSVMTTTSAHIERARLGIC